MKVGTNRVCRPGKRRSRLHGEIGASEVKTRACIKESLAIERRRKTWDEKWHTERHSVTTVKSSYGVRDGDGSAVTGPRGDSEGTQCRAEGLCKRRLLDKGPKG